MQHLRHNKGQKIIYANCNFKLEQYYVKKHRSTLSVQASQASLEGWRLRTHCCTVEPRPLSDSDEDCTYSCLFTEGKQERAAGSLKTRRGERI